jgi:UDP-N-acetylmuramoylalanine--D-glutamate ligase
MGLGLLGGGVEVTRYLARRGARVLVTDQRPAEALAESLAALADVPFERALGGHRERDFVECDLVVANPAVSPRHPLLARAREAGVGVTSEIELFLRDCTCRVVAITGTQGKSSTTKATWELLCAAGVRAHLGGNIGRSLLSDLERMQPRDVAVLELSSYQLEALSGPVGLGANVAAVAVVNVLADHLERHGSLEAYEAAKARLLELAGPGAAVVLNAEDARVSRWRPAQERVLWASPTGAVPRERAPLRVERNEFLLGEERLGRLEDLRLAGSFQRGNVLIALGLARTLGAAPAALEAGVGGLRGLEHRLQDLGSFAGHRVWDNGVSTTPDSTISALAELTGPLCLLLGGQRKNLPLDDLVAAVRDRRARVIAFGASALSLAQEFERGGVPALAQDSVEQAVDAAFEHMEPGDALLFSPACASFDAYRNFQDRARAFRAALARRGGSGGP